MSPLHPTDAEQELLLAHLRAMRAQAIRQFMRDHGLSGVSARKDELIELIREAITLEQTLTWDDVVDYLDEHEPYGKQHVILYKQNVQVATGWADGDVVAATLAQHGLQGIWQQRLRLAAPAAMELASVRLEAEHLTISAIARRTMVRRREDLERPDLIAGAHLEARVYEHLDVRSWVRFELDTGSGDANLHISQLPTKALYTETRDEFYALVSPWFPIAAFEPLPLGPAVAHLHEEAEAGNAEARVVGVDYETHGGLRSSVRSSAGTQSVVGETPELDDAMTAFRESGEGAAGNFYFLPESDGGLAGNPLEDEVHVVVIVKENRVNFMRPTEKSALEHVLSRIRVLAG